MNNECNCKKKCVEPCGCPEPVFSIEAMPDDPTVLRFNVNGKSVWYDFSSVVKAAETATTLSVNGVARTLDHHGEKSDQSIRAQELGSILHLADIGDVDENTIKDFGILNYRKNDSCPEGCEGTNNKWRADNPIELGSESLDYLLGSNAEGELKSLIPPTDTASYSYLAWAAGEKAKWVKPRQIAAATSNYAPLYLDKTTGEIVVLQGGA